MLKKMCEGGGVSGSKTNHSLRAYAVTELFKAGIPEKVIQDRTGHRSIEGLRKYERISEDQKENACKALAVRNDVSMPHCCPNFVAKRPGVLQPSLMQPSSNYSMHSSQQQQLSPTCSFGSATFNGCTINVFQAPHINHHNTSKDNVDELFSGDW